ncbi:EAL domain-containing protein [Maricaulis sp.]|uniref:EAL domain-containing protein n=1 Tax=Maricaulis sp. TaxID=1486257 RepID=UPI00260F4AB2|nr:EAL domain-containing protein [Maricaulis sp.]
MTLDGFERGARAAGALAFAIEAEGGTIAFSGALEAFGLAGAQMPLSDFIARLGPADGEALRAALASGTIDVRIRLLGEDGGLVYARLRGGAAADGRIDGLMTPAGRSSDAAGRLKEEHALADAVEAGDVLAWYQPVIALADESLAGFEALARWDRPGFGVLSPPDFLAMASQLDLLGPISDRVRRSAISDLASWRTAMPAANGLFVAANVSLDELISTAFQDAILAHVDAAGLPAGRFKLEVSETDIMRDPERAAEAMQRLSDGGVALALDDFGTGYSSLARLDMLPFDVIKIDQYFVRAMTANESAATVVQSVLQLASHFGMKVVAEGVESPQVARQLRDMGCDYAQGYCYAGALAPADAAGRIPEGQFTVQA